jgi:L-amino acid N-acyltransferase YncA
MNEEAPAYDIRTATTDDIPGLLALQAENQISKGGTLSIEFPAAWFTDVIREMPIVVAWREHRLVGFLVSSSKAATQHLSLGQAKFNAYPADPNAYNSGPLCIAATERGQGLVAKLFAMQRLLLPGREGVAFIRKDNGASRAAHSKNGFREVAEFSYAGVDYLVAARTVPPAV